MYVTASCADVLVFVPVSVLLHPCAAPLALQCVWLVCVTGASTSTLKTSSGSSSCSQQTAAQALVREAGCGACVLSLGDRGKVEEATSTAAAAAGVACDSKLSRFGPSSSSSKKQQQQQPHPSCYGWLAVLHQCCPHNLTVPAILIAQDPLLCLCAARLPFHLHHSRSELAGAVQHQPQPAVG